MKLIITFSARQTGNCAAIARYMADTEDRIVRFSDLHTTGCANCEYECFTGACPHRGDGVYELYAAMLQAERVILVVPMYGGNPSSLYYAFCERGQDFFRSEETWREVIRRLYIIGIYGGAGESPDYVPGLAKWFAGTGLTGRVLGLERHAYGQKMADLLLDVPEVRRQLDDFKQKMTGG